jgi:preprotein translocase subunit SecE
MEETNKKTASQPEKAKKDSKKDNKQESKAAQFFAEHRAELRKVTWPNRQELFKETVTVIVISLLVGAIIFCMDTALSWSYNKLMGIGSGSSNSTPIDTSVPIDLSGSSLPEGVEIVTGGADTEDAAVDAEAENDAADTAAEGSDAQAGAENEAAETPAADTEAAADSEAANADSEATDTANAGE